MLNKTTVAKKDNESKVEAVFEKNLNFALNAAESLTHLDRPVNYDTDPSAYQLKPTEDIQLNRFDVSYGGEQQVEAIVRKTLGPSDIRVSLVTPGNNPTKRNVTKVWPMQTAPAGERYGEVPGYYFERRRATIGEFPAVGTPGQANYSPPRYAAAGDLRRTVETRLAAARVGSDIRAQLQSHGLGGVQARHYDRHDYLAEKRAALETLYRLATRKAADVASIASRRATWAASNRNGGTRP